jgi:hypothetical protein
MKHIGMYFGMLMLLSTLSKGQPSAILFDKNVDIYLLMGQSNMAGRGKLTDDYKSVADPRVLMLNKANEWVPAKHPLHFDKPVAAVGPGLAFGIAMAEASPGKKIGLIPCAVGGTSINKWIPGAFDPPTKTHPWDDAEKRIKEGMKYGTIKGVIWHQGESDSNPDSAAIYLERLSVLINRIRTLAGDKKLPFVAGELGKYEPGYKVINDILVNLPAKVSNTALVSSEGLVHNGDHVHFDAASAGELGKRYAKAMLGIQKK